MRFVRALDCNHEIGKAHLLHKLASAYGILSVSAFVDEQNVP
jgi:hypothetical protein